MLATVSTGCGLTVTLLMTGGPVGDGDGDGDGDGLTAVVTVSVAVPAPPFKVAVTVVVAAVDPAVARPFALIVATDVLEEIHATIPLRLAVELSLNVAVAENAFVAPMPIVAEVGLTVIEARVALFETLTGTAWPAPTETKGSAYPTALPLASSKTAKIW